MTPDRREIARRAHHPAAEAPAKCRAYGCSRPPQRRSGTGLSEAYCKAHIEFHRRHGSYWRRSFYAAELAPFGKAARAWLRARRDDPTVRRVATALENLMARAGVRVSAYDLRPLAPKYKARAALARLRDAGVSGVRLIEITLAVSARIAEGGPYGSHEFLTVQIAKAAHRLASGTHRTRSGLSRIPSKYPRPEGRVLRLLGGAIWDLAAVAADTSAVEEVRLAGAAAETRSRER
jgi:hypothetical protein